MAALLKKQLFLKLMSHALYVGLDAFPKIGGVVKLACGWWQIIKDAQAQVSDAERIEQVEQAAACSPEDAQQAADGALAELRAQGQVLDAERVDAVRDIMTVMPAQIRERTRATLSHARRLGTEVAAVLPVTKRFKEDAQEQFYASLVPQRRPLFHAGDELPGANSKHEKTCAFARELLNDWDTFWMVLDYPNLPITNNEAERSLRHWVIARRISHGTRTTQGTQAFFLLASVIETCRKRSASPWIYIAEVVRLRRSGLPAPALPSVAV